MIAICPAADALFSSVRVPYYTTRFGQNPSRYCRHVRSLRSVVVKANGVDDDDGDGDDDDHHDDA